MAAMALKHAGHPVTTEPNWKSRPLGLVSGPNLWIKTSKASPCFSATYKSNGFLRFGIPSDRAVVIKYLNFFEGLLLCVCPCKRISVRAF